MNITSLAKKSTKDPMLSGQFVFEIKELIINDRTGLMTYFLLRAIEEGVREVIETDIAHLVGMEAAIWPAWVNCAEQILAARRAQREAGEAA